jgi:hypothetical protein
MPVTTRHQMKTQEMQKQPTQYKKSCANRANINHANIDFEDASKEWRKNKIKHENCCFTYARNS